MTTTKSSCIISIQPKVVIRREANNLRLYLKNLREQKELSQHDVAKLIGVSQQAYSLIENGDRQQDMKLSTLQKISEIFSTPLDEILKLENKYNFDKEG